MKKEKKIIDHLKKKYKKNVTYSTKVFVDLEIDSFEFIKVITELEKVLKKKYYPTISSNFSFITVGDLIKMFK